MLAFTEMVPPEVPGVTDIDKLVEEPVQPVGSVQVYDVAPLTGEML